MLAHYVPGTTNPHEVSVRGLVRHESSNNSSLNDLTMPFVVSATWLCGGDTSSRMRLREQNSNCVTALEGRVDLLGSVYHLQTKDGTGQVLSVLYISDFECSSS